MHRGLRQGDPLSPFLFILAAESLNIMMNQAVSWILFLPFKVHDFDVHVSHLQFADDAIFFGAWSTENATSLLAILRCFESVSGLRTNLAKSRLFGIRVDLEEVTNLAHILCCTLASPPFSYLGMAVGSNMSCRKSWDPVIKKIDDRLSAWKENLLSIGGWLTLIKSVLGSIPLYFLSVFRASAMVIKKRRITPFEILFGKHRKWSENNLGQDWETLWQQWLEGAEFGNICS